MECNYINDCGSFDRCALSGKILTKDCLEQCMLKQRADEEKGTSIKVIVAGSRGLENETVWAMVGYDTFEDVVKKSDKFYLRRPAEVTYRADGESVNRDSIIYKRIRSIKIQGEYEYLSRYGHYGW